VEVALPGDRVLEKRYQGLRPWDIGGVLFLSILTDFSVALAVWRNTFIDGL